ncbi:VOC family protein [Tabrizicola sp.]|uniref:VOC family protein n=1 Tax=Tabrizicola sp. TaxID=2005166 RepID=UPI003F305F8B
MGIPEEAKAVGFVLTADIGKAKPFYSEVLGLRLLFEDGFAAVYDCHGMVLRLTSVEGHKAHPHTVLGWQVPDIGAAMADLRARGVTFNVYPGFGQDADGVWTAPGGTVKVCWFDDPEGNGLSLTQS